MEIAVIIYFLALLLPINGLFWFGMRQENIKKRKLLKSMWKIKVGGKYGN